MAKSLNKVMLIGNLTRDPELKYTPQGTAVCTFSIATNRQWKTDGGDQKDEVEFHNIVSWQMLAEICSKLLKKGMKVFVEGRLQTRSWQGTDGVQKQRTEIVISDMIVMEPKRLDSDVIDVLADFGANELPEAVAIEPKTDKESKVTDTSKKVKKEEKPEDDIPF